MSWLSVRWSRRHIDEKSMASFCRFLAQAEVKNDDRGCEYCGSGKSAQF